MKNAGNLFETVTGFYDYNDFLKLVGSLVADERTTGPNQSEDLIGYTKLNLHRMHRWEKTFELPGAVKKELEQVRPQTWWLITEAWCGDSSQQLAQMHEMEMASGNKINLKIILRDEHPAIMDQFLTNGSRSIPKLIALDKEGRVLFSWGPRPLPAQKLMTDWKADHAGKTHDEIEREIHLWYIKDKGKTMVEELLLLLKDEHL